MTTNTNEIEHPTAGCYPKSNPCPTATDTIATPSGWQEGKGRTEDRGLGAKLENRYINNKRKQQKTRRATTTSDVGCKS